jgi:hypothetical protein
MQGYMLSNPGIQRGSVITRVGDREIKNIKVGVLVE